VTDPVQVAGQTLDPAQAQAIVDWFTQYDGVLSSLEGDMNDLNAAASVGNTQGELAACSNLKDHSGIALSYPDIPNTKLNQDWKDAWGQFEMVGTNCPLMLADPPNPSAVEAVPQQLTAGATYLNQLIADLNGL
jgi:hypothetical protein